jgi:multidrug efflux system membrane fusion protein
MFKTKYILVLLILVLASAVGYRVYFSGKPGMHGFGGAPDQAVPVSVAVVEEQEVELTAQFSGRLQAAEQVEIRPRVSGNIDKVLFTEGTIVEKDQELFVIDQRPYMAEYKRAEANLEAASAQAKLADTEYTRAETLVKAKAIAQQEFDQKTSMKNAADSAMKAAEAAFEIAKLNLNYSTIKSPIRGRVSRAEITEGNLVDPTTTKALATVVSIDPIYAEFNIDEQTYLKFIHNNSGLADEQKIPVEISLSGDNSVTKTGYIKSFDNRLDVSSGTIRARAEFDNKDAKLLSGLFVTVKLGSTERKKMPLISDVAVGTDQDKKFVFVVSDENKVIYRPVKLGQSFNGLRVVESGLEVGEKIIVNGLQRVRPDAVVAPEIVPMK